MTKQSTHNTTTIHLVSDRTGSTLERLLPSIKERFPQNGFIVRRYHRSDDQAKITEADLEGFINDIINTPGRNVVYMTLESDARADLMRAALSPLNIECVDPLAVGVEALARASGQAPLAHGISDDDSRRIETQLSAMQFWQQHDDGADLEGAFKNGQILLVASSRVGKTGACSILSLHGKRVANLPFVPGITDPEQLKSLIQKHPAMHVVALTRDHVELARLRENRMRTELPAGDVFNWERQRELYFSPKAVGQELQAFARFCEAAGIQTIIDVTRCQPEEIATRVLRATSVGGTQKVAALG